MKLQNLEKMELIESVQIQNQDVISLQMDLEEQFGRSMSLYNKLQIREGEFWTTVKFTSEDENDTMLFNTIVQAYL